MEVELPRTYFRLQEQSDYTANLTLSRMKFSCGTTGQVTFQCKKRGLMIGLMYILSLMQIIT